MLRPMKGVMGYLGVPAADGSDMTPTNDDMDTYAQSQGYSSYNAMVYALKQKAIDQRQSVLAVAGSGPIPASAGWSSTIFAPPTTNYAGGAASMGPPKPASSSNPLSFISALFQGAAGAAPNVIQAINMVRPTARTAVPPKLPGGSSFQQKTPWGTYAIIGGALLLMGGTAYMVTRPGGAKRAGRRAAIKYARFRRGKRRR